MQVLSLCREDLLEEDMATHSSILAWRIRGQRSLLGYSLLLLLLLRRFSRVRLCETPKMAAHRAPSSLGFSRQEHSSGLSFPTVYRVAKSQTWPKQLSFRHARTQRFKNIEQVFLKQRTRELSFLWDGKRLRDVNLGSPSAIPPYSPLYSPPYLWGQ